MSEEKKTTVNVTTLVIVVLLVLAAFILGMNWEEILGRQEKAQTPETQPVAQDNQTPPEPAVLGETQVAEIEEGGAAVKGNENAPVTIVEFSEYQCPFCKRYVDESYQKIFEEYGDQIRYIFRDYPLEFHQHAQKTAEAARCAGDQNQYWSMHDLLFSQRDEWANEAKIDSLLADYASQLSLDKAEFNSCLTSGKHTQAVKDDLDLGKKIGVSGTPSFFINGQKLVGAHPFENFKKIIDEELGQ